jgi:hypothetical protein
VGAKSLVARTPKRRLASAAASSAAVGTRMLLWDRIQGEPSRASTQVPRRHGGVNSCAGSETIVVPGGSAMSAVNHQFRLAVRWRKHFHRPRGVSLDGPGKLAKSNADQVARATADRRESRHCLTMINGCCAQRPAIRGRLAELGQIVVKRSLPTGKAEPFIPHRAGSSPPSSRRCESPR